MNKVIVDKARLLRRVIVISWVTLALCFVVKIFGGNFFEIMCENPNYKALCEYADTHLWLKYTLGLVSSLLSISLYLLAIVQQYKFTKKQFAWFLPSIIISCFIKLFNNNLGLIGDLWVMFGLPLLFLPKGNKRLLTILTAFGINFSFQLISLLTKNLSLGFIDNSTFVGLIYMIDLYLMCWLYYLYRNYKKEMNNMGIFFVLFAGKPADKLKAMREKRLAKIAKLQAEVNAIEIELSKKKDDK